MTVKSLKRAQRKIQVKDLKLNALLEVTLAINSNVSKGKLFEIYKQVLRELDIEKVVLFTNENEWNVAMSYGMDVKSLEIDVEKDLLSVEEIIEVNSNTDGAFREFDLLVPVFHKTKPLAYLLIGDIINEAIKISPIIKHLNFIQTFTNIIAVAIENKNLAKKAIKQERVKKELELASEMQNMLLPTTLPKNEQFDIAAFYKSHEQVGGDYYDVMWIDDNKLVFCIADVSGKGVSAAILMSNFQANLRAGVTHSVSLEALVNDLNQKVMDNAKGEKFITMFIGVYEKDSRELTYVNCGHNPPFFYNNGKIEALKNGCPGLGMLDDLPVPNIGKVKVGRKATLVCYTDGLVEVENNSNLEYGTERIVYLLERNSNKSMDFLNNSLITDLKIFKEDQPYVDDIAILSCFFA
jgi:sigma-B regulation protein RsbU (phosphoserine phosphatase)